MLTDILKFAQTIDPALRVRVCAFLTETLPILPGSAPELFEDVVTRITTIHIRPYPGGMPFQQRHGGEILKLAMVVDGSETLEYGAFFLHVLPQNMEIHRLSLKTKKARQ